MAMADRLKAFAARGRTKSSNLYQNEDLVEELGYQAPAPTPKPAAKAGFMSALSKAVGRRKKPAVTGVATIRG